MRYGRKVSLSVVALLTLLLLALLSRAALEILSGETFTASDTIANPSNALGQFDDTIAVVSSGWRGGDVATWTITNFTREGAVTEVKFTVRFNGTGFDNDNVNIQYSNDSGTTWFNVQTGVTPATTLTHYGNYTVTSSFPSNSSIANMQVRILYNQVAGPDSTSVSFDGVEVYVTYTPPDTTPPNVTLNRPLNYTFSASQNVSFNFTAADDAALKNCSLYVNGTLNASNQTSVSNGNPTIINVTFGTDGDYRWNVTCFDTSNNSNTSNVSFIVRVDTTPPNVTLNSPANNSVSTASLNSFSFNVTDAASIASCRLFVDGTQKDSTTSPPKGAPVLLNATLTNGDHPWYVNCTDANGFIGLSAAFNLSVQVTTPTIVTDKGSYEQGESVNYTGGNWQAGANVSINVTGPGGYLDLFNLTVNSSGDINATRVLSYGVLVGQYNVSARQTNDTLLNASVSFTVTARAVNLTADKASYVQGESALIRGTGFSPNTSVNLTIRLPGGWLNLTNLTANATGGFNFTYVLNFTHPLGTHNASGRDLNYSNLFANTSFDVTLRVPVVFANASVYRYNSTVGITGDVFSFFATIVLRIYDTVTGLLGPGFPVVLVANATGGFNYSWWTNSTCSGNYTVIAEDQNTTSFKANTSFVIDNQLNLSVNRTVQNASGNRVTPSVAAVNASDDTRNITGLTGSILDGYLQFGFFPGLPDNASFRAINVTIEHLRTSSKVTAFQMYLLRGGELVLLSGTGCSGTPPDVEGKATCDITGEVTNVSVANNLYVRVNYTRTGGGGGDAEVDFAQVNYSWTGDPVGCFEFGNEPVAPTVFNLATTGTVVLNAGARKTVECNFTVSDGNGADEIVGANATFFTPPDTAGSPDDNRTHYTNGSCSLVSAGGSSKDYTCAAQLWFYARNGTWTCNATGVSVDGFASDTAPFTVDPLYALNVTSTLIDFGNLTTGQVSRNVSENVTNVGNMLINISVYGYGTALGDGQGLRCLNENISVERVRFSGVIDHAYADKANLSLTLQYANLSVRPQENASGQWNVSYWQLQVPANLSVTGLCNGTVVFQAGEP